MEALHEALIQRFGAEQIREIPANQQRATPLLAIRLKKQIPQTILMTHGLHAYAMLVPEKYLGREHHELYFLVPDYWDLDDPENPRMNWVYTWLDVLAQRVREKQTWHGPGHTIAAGNPPQSLSETMRQNHFFFTDPISLKDELAPIQLEQYAVHFLGLIPIFDEELDFKMAKGAHKLHKKFEQHGITEELDDFRRTSLKTRWRFFG